LMHVARPVCQSGNVAHAAREPDRTLHGGWHRERGERLDLEWRGGSDGGSAEREHHVAIEQRAVGDDASRQCVARRVGERPQRHPAGTAPPAPTTSPPALTPTSAPTTTSPPSPAAAHVPTPPFIAARGPSALPTVAPVPAPTDPSATSVEGSVGAGTGATV